MKVPGVFWISIFLVGALTGFLVGGSQSPLASAALPIFASFLAATATFFLARHQQGSGSTAQLRTVSNGYLLFVLGFLPYFFLGIFMRLGPVEYISFGPYLYDWGDKAPYERLESRREREQYFVLSAHLTALGVGPVEQRSFLSAVVLNQVAARASTAETLSDVVNLEKVSGSLKALAACDPAPNSVPDFRYIMVTGEVLADLAQHLRTTTAPPHPQCSIGCKTELLLTSAQVWSVERALERAPACGLAADEIAEVRRTVRVFANSPMELTVVEMKEIAEDFHKLWGVASGAFTEAAPATIGSTEPLVQESMESTK